VLCASGAQADDFSALLAGDGMHPTAQGGELIYRQVVQAITRHYPRLQPASATEWRNAAVERLPLDLPDFKAVDFDNVHGSIISHRQSVDARQGLNPTSASVPGPSDVVELCSEVGASKPPPPPLDEMSPREDDDLGEMY
jgi:hypothetical protein